MTIDISKIRPGDKVTLVPLEVNRVNADSTVMIVIKDGTEWLLMKVAPSEITAHHPAPREFQVGDRVTSNGKADVGTIEHVARGKARVIWDDTWDVIMPLEILTLVEAGQ